MFSILRYTLLSAIKDHLFVGLIVFLLLMSALGYFLGSTALVEQVQTRITFISGGCRLINILGLILFISVHVQRSYELHEIDFLLSKSISRVYFTIAYFSSYVFIACFFSIITSIILLFSGVVLGKAIAVWTLSLFLESLIVASFTFAVSMILEKTVPSVLMALGFYLLARLSGFFMSITHDLSPVFNVQYIVEHLLLFISIFVPRIDLFTQTKWLLYGVEINMYYEMKLLILQSFIYIMLMLLMAIWDIRRKEF